MDKGEVLEQGTAEKVADEYLKRAHARGNERLSLQNRGTSTYPRWGSGEVEVTEVEMLGPDGAPTLVLRTDEPFTVRLRYRASAECKQPVFGIGLYRSDGTYINGSNHHWREQPIAIGAVQAGESGAVEMSSERLQLLHGQYYLTTFLYDHSKAAPTPVDHREHVLTFEVQDKRRNQHGMLSLPSRWKVVRKPAGGPESSQESAS
jgi:lipopolysaccharide transport system ATP-binding protein